ncbi:hypothetical protein PUN28_014235 [Cardiocondyla obscurior]|uniref:Uncharacterized protein n=1 Tax=Cardiocondyla obscurior TaxID=286306 RepID=A0AAW2F515_9HYME
MREREIEKERESSCNFMRWRHYFTLEIISKLKLAQFSIISKLSDNVVHCIGLLIIQQSVEQKIFPMRCRGFFEGRCRRGSAARKEDLQENGTIFLHAQCESLRSLNERLQYLPLFKSYLAKI